jgi:hypothetical protein
MFQRIVLDDPDLSAALEDAPDQVIHFAIDLRTLDPDPAKAVAGFRFNLDDWDEDDNDIVIKDTRIDDVWGDMNPVVRMTGTYGELKQELTTPSGKRGFHG